MIDRGSLLLSSELDIPFGDCCRCRCLSHVVRTVQDSGIGSVSLTLGYLHRPLDLDNIVDSIAKIALGPAESAERDIVRRHPPLALQQLVEELAEVVVMHVAKAKMQ